MTGEGTSEPLPFVPAGTPAPDGQAWLRGLHWRQFEDLVAGAYRLQGYTVLPTSPGADGGIDLILVRGEERIFVQCKHWKAWQVGAPVIRELFGLVAANRATRGIVVTSGSFSREAVEFARQTGTELLDGPALLALVATGAADRLVSSPPLTHFAAQPAPAATAAPSADPSAQGGVPTCPVCLAPMVLRKARRGAGAGSLFWGCTRFPGCRGARAAAADAQLPPTRAQQSRRSRKRRAAALSLAGMAVGALVVVLVVTAVAAALRTAATAPLRLVPIGPKPSAPASSHPQPGIGEQPMDLGIAADGTRVYTANYASRDISVLDTGSMTVVDTIDVPGKPISLAVSGSTLYVADRSGRKVRAIDLATGETSTTYRTGRLPCDLAVDTSANRLFIAHEDGAIWAYQVSTRRRLATLDMYAGGSIAVDAGEHKLYANNSSGVLQTFDSYTLRPTGTTYAGRGKIAVDSRRQRLYVAAKSRLNEHNVLTGKLRQVPTGIDARSVVVDSRSRTAYLADPDTNTVVAVSLK